MRYLNTIVERASAKLRRIRSDDPLLRPIGRTPDSAIDAALAEHGMARADLFRPGDGLAPHRHRIAAMLAALGLTPSHVVARHWPELKIADHACAHCIDKKRCDKWLRGRRPNDAPRMFCPNLMTFERWRRCARQSGADGAGRDIDLILEAGLARTRELLQHIRPQKPPRSNRH